MNKADYLDAEEDLKQQILDLQDDLIQMEKDYIEEHRKYSIGDLVKFHYPAHKATILATEKSVDVPAKDEYAYVHGFKVIHGEVEYQFLAMKKNGEPSKQRYYPSYGGRIIEVDTPAAVE